MLYHKIINFENLSDNEVEEIKILEDGNCYYNNLSYYYTGKQDYNQFFRLLIYKYIKKNKNDVLIHNPYTLINEEIVDIEDYIELIKNNTFYSGDLEIAKTKEIFNLNLAVYRKSINNNNGDIIYTFDLYYNTPNTNFINDLIILVYYPQKRHYGQLHYKKSNNLLNDNNCNKEKVNPVNSKKIKDINNKENNVDSIIEDLKNILKNYKAKLSKNINKNKLNENLTFDEKIKLGYTYPIYPNHKYGDKILFYVRKYLISKKK